jgi:chaperonin GroES
MAKKKKAAAKPKTTSKSKAASTPASKAASKAAPKAPNLRPLGDRILVKRVEARDIVKGGIIIPDSAKEKPQEGIVVALGEGRKTTSGKLLPFEVGIGDRVMIEKYSGSEVTIDDEEYTIIKEDGVLAILEQ